MNFGGALDKLKSGGRVCRPHWNRYGELSFLVLGRLGYRVNKYREWDELMILMCRDSLVSGEWSPHTIDILSEDWRVVDESIANIFSEVKEVIAPRGFNEVDF